MLHPIIRAVAEADHTPLEKLHVLIDDTVTFFDERPYFRRLMRHVRGDATITGPVLATFADRVNHRFEEALTLIATIVEDGQVRGQIREGNGAALAHLYSVLVNEFILLPPRTTTRPHRTRSRRRSFMALSTGLFARPPYRRERRWRFFSIHR